MRVKEVELIRLLKLAYFVKIVSYSDTDDVFPDLEARRSTVRRKASCQRCLRTRHGIDNCRAALRPCYRCKHSKHLRSMCPVKFKTRDRL